MFSFIQRMRHRFQKMTPSRPTRAARRGRLCVESLEGRTRLSTLFISPNITAPNATHFHRFQDAYQAAKAGDVIQVEPGAAVKSVGDNFVGVRVAGGAVGTKT